MPTQITNTASSTYSFGSGRVSSATSNVASTTLLAQYQIEATKTAPSNVLCGENFDYNLIFENVGVNVATGVSILDYLPKEFVINYVKVVNGNITLERGIDYNYDENANPLLITDTGTSLNINPGEMLVVTINGKIPYLTD